MTTRDDLVSRLRDQLTGDHARGCQGRSYSCDCGYDLATEGLLELAANALEAKDAEIARLTSDLSEADAAIEAFGTVSPQQYQKELAALKDRITSLERQLAEERERCARIAQNVGSPVGAGDGCGTRVAGTSWDAAAAIRGGAK